PETELDGVVLRSAAEGTGPEPDLLDLLGERADRLLVCVLPGLEGVGTDVTDLHLFEHVRPPKSGPGAHRPARSGQGYSPWRSSSAGGAAVGLGISGLPSASNLLRCIPIWAWLTLTLRTS